MVNMKSLKIATIHATFDTLDDREQSNLIIELMLRKWGLNDATAPMIHLEFPNASMIFLYRVLGDLTYDDWLQAIERFKQLGIKSARCYIGRDPYVHLCTTERKYPWCDVDPLQSFHRREYIEWEYDNFDDFAYYVPWDAEWYIETDFYTHRPLLKDVWIGDVPALTST
jgi:hypothetical protein